MDGASLGEMGEMGEMREMGEIPTMSAERASPGQLEVEGWRGLCRR